MNQVLTYTDEVIQETDKMPSACLVLPFEPQMNDKSSIESRLKSMLTRAESHLLQQYSNRKALPVLTRLQQLATEIVYYNYKKSIALLATTSVSKLFYLDFPVMETVRTGEDLGLRDVVKAKSKSAQYLVLVFDKGQSTMYEGEGMQLSLIKHNEQIHHDFLQEMDRGLDLVLRACPFPVFVLGGEAMLDGFKKITVHGEQVIAYLPGRFEGSTTADIVQTLKPVLHQWHKSKQCLLLQKLDKADRERQLSYGLDKVWETATHRRSQLLVLEEDLVGGELNDVIEKVLKDGGEVEFVDDGLLSRFGQIALIYSSH